ncbi:MAG: prenyltransferase [Candidatus Bathyarchaeota archaeon]|nr:prenyltransferase [Candidatus Bathyarchaeota archaeon]
MSLKTWYIATRPWSLVMTFVSTCLAGILAYASGSFSIPIFMLTMIGLLIAHTAANMANDWYDVRNGVDENAPTAKYRPHPLLFGEVDKATYKKVVFAVYGVGILIGLYLTMLRGLPVLIFTALGVLFGVFYTADPIKLKYLAVGEISVFLAFGPLMVGGAYYALTGTFSWDPMFASIPIGLLVALVLLANNIRDKDFDASVGISTIMTSKNVSQGITYYKCLLASAYVATLVLIYTGTLSVFSIITFLTLKEALGILKTFDNEVPLTSDQITAQLALHFGVLLTVGEFIGIVIGSLL